MQNYRGSSGTSTRDSKRRTNAASLVDDDEDEDEDEDQDGAHPATTSARKHAANTAHTPPPHKLAVCNPR
jgi:hypothetical protein